MKHEQHLTDTDRADLDRAAQLVANGRLLRRQVLARVRARVHRKTKAERENSLENTPANPQKSAIVR